MSYRPKGLDMKDYMKRLEEEESNLEYDADSVRPPNINDGESSALMGGDKLEIGQCLLENLTMFSKASKVSKRDVDGIKTTKLDMSELNDRISNRNHTHIIDKASAYTKKHGLVSFGPKISRLDALGNQMDRSLRTQIEKFNQTKALD